MKNFVLVLLGSLFSYSAFCYSSADGVNRLISDESFIKTFHQLPGRFVDESLRIAVHLAYVERLLSEKNTDHLNARQRTNRKRILQLLHEYWNAGRFPKNEKFSSERRPCFIDSNGNICAVGYLFEKTIGRNVAEQINASHQYDYVEDMHEDVLNKWAGSQGLTLEECAMIQPQYDFGPPEVIEQPIKTGYGITSGILGGVNVALITTTIANPRLSARFAYAGLVTGAAQIIYGATNIKKQQFGSFCINCASKKITYNAQNNLSYINIAAGAATFLTSAINLAVNKKTCRKNAFNLYSYPGINNRMNVGVAIARRI